MKTNEQIKIAENLINVIGDYVVLAKADKKLKTTKLSTHIDEIVNEIKNKVEDI